MGILEQQHFYKGIYFTFLQVASCTNQMGQIAIVAMQSSSPKVTECFNVESRILCMAYVPAEQTLENGEKASENSHMPPGRASETPTVCLGMEEGRYELSQCAQKRLCSIFWKLKYI